LSKEKAGIVKEAIASLSDRERTILTLMHVHHLQGAEIGRIVGVSESPASRTRPPTPPTRRGGGAARSLRDRAPDRPRRGHRDRRGVRPPRHRGLRARARRARPGVAPPP